MLCYVMLLWSYQDSKLNYFYVIDTTVMVVFVTLLFCLGLVFMCCISQYISRIQVSDIKLCTFRVPSLSNFFFLQDQKGCCQSGSNIGAEKNR